MRKDFDIKRIILTIRDLEWKMKKLLLKFNIKDNDSIFTEQNPENFIVLRKENYWKKLKEKINKGKKKAYNYSKITNL